MRAELALPGLAGRLDVEPAYANGARVLRLPRRDALPRSEASVFGTYALFATRGLALDLGGVVSSARAGGSYETCLLFGGVPRPLDFYPGCSTDPDQDGFAVRFTDTLVRLQRSAMLNYGAATVPAGALGLGGNFESVGPVESFGHAAALLEFDPPAAVPLIGELAADGIAGVVRGRKAFVPVLCLRGPCRGSIRLSGGPSRRFELAAGARARLPVPFRGRGQARVEAVDAAGRSDRWSIKLRRRP